MTEYKYLSVPIKYSDVYNVLLNLLVVAGEDYIKDCSASCNNKNIYLFKCWNIFQKACNIYDDDEDKADKYISYIKTMLNISNDMNNSNDNKIIFVSAFDEDSLLNYIKDKHYIIKDYYQDTNIKAKVNVQVNQYIYIIYPLFIKKEINITMSDFDCPIDDVFTIEINNNKFNAVRTHNAFKEGEYDIVFST